MKKLLVKESPLQLLPTLAVKIGVNEAIVLQQLHYLTTAGRGEEIDGATWFRYSVQDWRKIHFPFWSDATINRIFTSLRKQKLVRAENHNQTTYDRTLWYSVDYATLCENGYCDNENSILSDCQNGVSYIDNMEVSKVGNSLIEKNKEEKEETNDPAENGHKPDADEVSIVRELSDHFQQTASIFPSAGLWEEWETALVSIYKTAGGLEAAKSAITRAVAFARDGPKRYTIRSPMSLTTIIANLPADGAGRKVKVSTR